MCYSAMVEQNEKRLAQRFGATLDGDLFARFRQLQAFEQEIGFSEIKEYLGMSRTPKVSQFRWGADQKDCRIYPGYFAPTLTMKSGQRVFEPMRYRVRPFGSKNEIPSKYNVFNCRLDSIQSRRTWIPLFGVSHSLFPFIKFYEWVDGTNAKKVQLSFHPKNHEIMWAPALYDCWSSPDGNVQFKSFALITDEPPPEITAAGHDRCPIFLKENEIDEWLTPENKTKEELLDILNQRESVFYLNSISN